MFYDCINKKDKDKAGKIMGIVELRNISKSYGSRKILKDICFNVNEGDFWSITGDSGSGKTTLLNIIGLLDSQDEGDVCIDGITNPKENTKIWRYYLRNKISFVYQNYGLLEGETVEYNLKLVMKGIIRNKKNSTDNMLMSLNQVGLNDVLNKPVYQLSGGEQQRVALAKCILKNTDIILADEPTGNLDPDNRDMIMNIFKYMNKKGKTIIVATHDKEVVKCSEKNIAL